MTDARWTEAELAYFAGILDGEGCLSLDSLKQRISGGHRVYHNPCIRVSNTDARLIQWIQARFPGRVAPVKIRALMRKPQWTWSLYGPTVEAVLVAVVPHLVIKREQAELLIEYRRTMLPRGAQRGWKKNAHSLSDTTLVQRGAVVDRLRLLNKRGIAS